MIAYFISNPDKIHLLSKSGKSIFCTGRTSPYLPVTRDIRKVTCLACMRRMYKAGMYKNPVKEIKSLIICPRCGTTYTQTSASKISRCVKCGYRPNPAYGVGMTAMTRGTAPISTLNLSTGKRELALFPRQAVRLLEKVGNSWVVTTGRKDVLLVPSGNISLRSNPILADLGASALAGFGLAAGWKGFEWGLKKLKGKKSKSIAHKAASSNPWIYPWQREKK